MNYSEKKQELIEKRNKVLAIYADLYESIEELSKDTRSLKNYPETEGDLVDLYTFLNNDANTGKLDRLTKSLRYVEDPNNQTITSLEANIKFNVNTQKTKIYKRRTK